MSDRTLLYLTLAVSVASLVVTVKMALALQQAKNDVDKTVSDIRAPFEGFLQGMGW